MTGDLSFSHLNGSEGHIVWTGGSVLERLKINDTSTASNSVYSF
jgi:hypothetical protein